MKDIADINNKLNEDKDLCHNLDLLINYSLEHKKLIFNQGIIGINFEKLIESQVIKLEFEKFHLIDFETFGCRLYSRNKSKSTLSKDFKTFVLLLEEIQNAYKSDKRVKYITTLLNELWAIAILDSNRIFKSNFSGYLKSLDKEANREEIYSFNEGYSRALHLIKLEIPDFYRNAIQLINWTNSDALYNLPLGIFLKSIHDKIIENSHWGLKCFEYSIKQTDLEINYLIPIITGLYEKEGINFYRENLGEKVKHEIFAVSIICGLSNVKFIRDEECELFFEIFNQVDKENSSILLNLPKLLFAILKSNNGGINKDHINTTFSLLDQLLEFDNTQLISLILREIEFLDNHLELRHEIIISLIKKSHFKKEYLNSIAPIFFHSKDTEFFAKILYSLGDFIPFKTISGNLMSSINQLRYNCKHEFDKVLVELFIDDKASIRFIAIDIFSSFSLENYSFDYNILELNSLSQYKLWVSLLQNYREPKHVLPCLLPLLKSKSLLVKEAFICKLEEYSENYGAHVSEILKQYLDFSDEELKAAYDRIEKHRIDFFNKNIRVKEGVKELNPVFTQNKNFNEFNKSFNRNFNRQYKKSSSENSLLLNLCTKVTLLKGGGWKIDGRDEISKLGIVSTSFSLPRIYLTQPEHFDYDNSVEMVTNWDDTTFADIKRVLDYE